uniref:EGF-like domain-containing protein n=1 Tax=Chromera velia CCMP2878 TaxID=1169474 RepID=A0A0G4GNA4_9ALVE|eukprot:Cvel_22648.t1-p1 / transcript=Cvel_22648.t1 / gene=Cvel_22648 / organism=Chromera_velia_CCMP2878 / gene_product=Mucin-2, putative / transcript_product=Mucin-2, putative / location=Cvel_scaffold2248:9053-20831(+) / protein_length=2132 / sequence_SO=supercontig / SO=protein_coding / is_pseudo=false
MHVYIQHVVNLLFPCQLLIYSLAFTVIGPVVVDGTAVGGTLEELTHAASAVPRKGGGGHATGRENLKAAAGTQRRRLWDATTVLSSSYLTGSNGFYVAGVTSQGNLGGASGITTVGDVNNDGVDDFILGEGGAGNAYVIFGRDWKSSSFPAEIDLSTLDGTNGFKIIGSTSTLFAWTFGTGGGDFNNDGIADIIIGAAEENVSGATGSNNGKIYLIFGKASWSATVTASALSGSDGVIFNGVGDGSRLGFGVGNAGDVNGDGIDDITFTAYRTNQGGTDSGAVFVYFGKSSGWTSPITVTGSIMDGVVGFRINGEAGDQLGVEMAGNVDINNDGIKDIIFSGWIADPVSSNEGRVHVFYGKSSSTFSGTYSVTDIDGTNGFTVNGVVTEGRLGSVVAGLGDVNGDGIDDWIAGAYLSTPESLSSAGEAVVIFGSSDFSALDAADGSTDGKWKVDALDGSNGFRFYGTAANDNAGVDVQGPGDVNGDGVNDILISSVADPNGLSNAGEAYLVFGRKVSTAGNFASVLRPSDLDGTNGIIFQGSAAGDQSQNLGRAGDINKDGVNDFIVGAHKASPNSLSTAGEVYVLFGKADECTLGTHNCHATHATCTDTVNSFSCTCNSGYSGTGVACSISSTSTVCTGESGCLEEWTCASYGDCERLISETDGICQCVDVDECALGTHVCPSIATCKNTPGAYECELPETVETSTLEADSGEDEGAAGTVLLLNSLKSFVETTTGTGTGSDGSTPASSTSESLASTKAVADKISSTISNIQSSGRTLTSEETESFTTVLATTSKGLDSLLSGTDSSSLSQNQKDSQTSEITNSVTALASSLSAVVSRSSSVPKSRSGKSLVGSQLPVLSSLEKTLQSASADAGVTAGGDASGANGTALASRRKELQSATDSVIKTATASIAPLVLRQATSSGSSVMSTDSFSVAATALPSPTAVADARSLSAEVGPLSISLKSFSDATAERLRALAGTCGDSDQAFLGLAVVTWGSDVRNYVGGTAKFGASQSVRLMWCGEDVGARVFGSDQMSVTVGGLQGAGGDGSGNRRRRRLSSSVEEEGGCSSFDGENDQWSSLCKSVAGGGCECEGAGAGLMETEFGEAIGDVASILAGADLSVLWQFDRAREGATIDNALLWVVGALLGGFLLHILIAIWRDRCSPRTSMSVVEAACLNTKAVLAAAWENRHQMNMCSFEFVSEQIEKMVTEGDTGLRDRYQHPFSSDCAYPLNTPPQTAEAEEAESNDAAVSGELGDSLDLQALSFRQTDLVALLTADAQKVLAQGVRGTRNLERGQEAVVITPEVALIEDRNHSCDSTRKGNVPLRPPLHAPLWDPRPPPVLPFSLRLSLSARWRRDLIVEPFGDADWQLLSAARFLICSGHFKRRLEFLAERQASRYRMLETLVRSWLVRKGLRKSDSFLPSEKRKGQTAPNMTFCANLRGFLLPWPAACPPIGSGELYQTQIVSADGQSYVQKTKDLTVLLTIGSSFLQIRAFSRQHDLSVALPSPMLDKYGLFLSPNLNPGNGRARSVLVVVPQRCVLDSGSRIISDSRLASRDFLFARKEGENDARTPVPLRVWKGRQTGKSAEKKNERGAVRHQKQGSVERSTSRLSPLEGAVEFLEESPHCSVLRLFVRCPEAPSGVVGLDMSNARPVTKEEIDQIENEQGSGAFVGEKHFMGSRQGEGVEKGGGVQENQDRRFSMNKKMNQIVQTINQCSGGGGKDRKHPFPTLEESHCEKRRVAAEETKFEGQTQGVEESRETIEVLCQIADQLLQWKRDRSAAFRSMPVWTNLGKQLEEDMKRIRPFGWSTAYLAARLFLRPLQVSVLGKSSDRHADALIPRATAVLISWTSAFSFLFLFALFFGVLSEDTPEISEDMGFLEILSAVVSTFTGRTILAAFLIYGLTLPVSMLTDFLLRPRTPQVTMLKNLSEKARRGGRVTVEDANYFWGSRVSTCRPPEEKGSCCCLKRGASEKKEKGRQSLTANAVQSLLPSSRRRREAVNSLVGWRRKKVGEEREKRVVEDGSSEMSIYRASKKWVLPESYRAWWLWRNHQRTVGGICFCVFWILLCAFYLVCFALNYPVRPADLAQVGTTVLGLLIIHGVIRPLFLSAGLGASLVLLLSVMQHPGTDL